MPDTDGEVVGGAAGVLVAVLLLLVHDTATSPTSTTIATASRFIFRTNSSADIGHGQPATTDDKPR